MEVAVELGAVVLGAVTGGVLIAAARRLVGGDENSIWRRLLAFLLSTVILLVGFGVVVEFRCATGWIDEDECPVWDPPGER